MSEEYIVDVDHLTIRFNMASEKVDNLKEYVIKLIKHELMFQEFLALKDVNLKVKRGEAWGLIGTNGSGKSTLLKACCGILKPYKGSVTTRGTIAPLIELGAGFDMNMTARENVFLNGQYWGIRENLWKSILMKLLNLQNCGISLMCRSRIFHLVCRQGLDLRLRRW